MASCSSGLTFWVNNHQHLFLLRTLKNHLSADILVNLLSHPCTGTALLPSAWWHRRRLKTRPATQVERLFHFKLEIYNLPNATLTWHHGWISIFLFVALLLSVEAFHESAVALCYQLENRRNRADGWCCANSDHITSRTLKNFASLYFCFQYMLSEIKIDGIMSKNVFI